MRLCTLRFLALPVIAVLFIALAACNSNSNSSTPTAGASPSASNTAATSTAAASPSAGTSATASASAGASASATASTVDPAAVQVLPEYYQAINAKEFDTAYKLWADNGAASGQTSDQFANGFAQTVRTVIHLGKAAAKNGTVEVPANVLSVINTGNPAPDDQAVQHFEGTYTLAQSGGAWHIASASLAKKPDLTDVYPPAASDTGVLQAYYDAINAHEFGTAYTLWENNGEASQQSYIDFANGFAKTASSTLTMGEPQQGGAAGSIFSDIPVFIVAKQADGSQQAFCGKFTLRRANVPPFPFLGWGIYSASISPHPGVIPSADGVQALLKNGCQG